MALTANIHSRDNGGRLFVWLVVDVIKKIKSIGSCRDIAIPTGGTRRIKSNPIQIRPLNDYERQCCEYWEVAEVTYLNGDTEYVDDATAIALFEKLNRT